MLSELQVETIALRNLVEISCCRLLFHSCLNYCFGLKTEPVRSSETSVRLRTTGVTSQEPVELVVTAVPNSGPRQWTYRFCRRQVFLDLIKDRQLVHRTVFLMSVMECCYVIHCSGARRPAPVITKTALMRRGAEALNSRTATRASLRTASPMRPAGHHARQH